MKISKLFHWLYAILMFLPILVFIPNAFYYGFNKEAVAQEKTEQVPLYYQSNEVNSYTDLINGNVYHWNDNLNITDYDGTERYIFSIENNYIIRSYFTIPENATNIVFYLNNQGKSRIRYTDSDNVNRYITNSDNVQFNFVLITVITQYEPLLSHIEICNNLYLTGQTTPVTTNMSITDSMSYAWKSVWQNDLFSWTDNTFLKQPFVYITDLFSIPSDNVLINALSYWLDISIIWLVFDVIMYVPLLTHRWLDKGIVE